MNIHGEQRAYAVTWEGTPHEQGSIYTDTMAPKHGVKIWSFFTTQNIAGIRYPGKNFWSQQNLKKLQSEESCFNYFSI